MALSHNINIAGYHLLVALSVCVLVWLLTVLSSACY